MLGGPGWLSVPKQKTLTEKDLDNKETNKTNNKEFKNDKNGKKTKKKRHYSHPHGNNVLSYPLGMSPDEANGGRLQITCFEYVPAGANPFTELTPLKAQKDMTISADASEADREIGDGYITSLGSGGSKYVDAGQNLEKGQNVLSGGKNIYKVGKLSNMGASDQINKKEKTLYYVELPIPQDVNDSNTVTWGDDSKNILQLAGLAAGTALVGDGENGRVNLEQLRLNLISASLDASTEISNNKNAIIAAATGKALDAFGAQVTPNSALGRSQGQILNSNLELLFDSVNLRTFPFSITFSPRNFKESTRVKHIIRAFKSSMAAKKGRSESGDARVGQGGAFLSAPDVFKLKYLHNGAVHPFLNSFKPCALTGMTVNYTNSGTYASYHDGTPVSIKMNLTFKELNPIYHEDYDVFSEKDDLGVGF